jgi:hypothetical protein
LNLPPQLNTAKPQRNPWVYILIGAAVTLVFVIGCVLVAGAVFLFRSSSAQSTEVGVLDASAQLTVDADGCGVIRTEITGTTPVTLPSWVVTDSEGYVVLDRNAEGEYKYRYFSGGKYTVHLNAWYDGAYHQISNQVAINCK